MRWRKIWRGSFKRLAAGNGIGEKLPMLVIGKAEKPRCFKGAYRVRIGPKRNSGWTLKSLLVM